MGQNAPPAPAQWAASAALKASAWMDSSGKSRTTYLTRPVLMYACSIWGIVSRTCRAQNGHW